MYMRTVLIVEDELLIRWMLAEALADLGYKVLEAGTVLEAVGVLSRHRVDAVITDIDMPGALNGLDLARLVSRTYRKAALIIASGGHRLGEDDLPANARFVAKPYAAEALANLLSSMLDARPGAAAPCSSHRLAG
ncbi:response regulator [Rhizobium sp. SSA_523]|uniref:response regulator n=1 Tax=Rhizobium sp. SSA_523 TaxID=2952477 RepID=UPI00209057F3|nr:response regulator [Rhizobium sp. SSA_523]MCO5732088.1 response regulator [Rhizobium sp. SSA_523]WKC25664.1 response regulator [Rhizobium sp. SSA_523]